MMSTLWKQFIGAILDDFLGTRFTKNAILSTWKLKSGFFCEKCRNLCSATLLAIPQWNTCANFGHIWTNYVMNVAKTLLLHLESYECLFVIASFWEHFSSKTCAMWVYIFSGNYVTYDDATRRFSIFLIFFEFRMLIWKSSRIRGRDRSCLVFESYGYFDVSMMKWIVVNLKMKFRKNNGQAVWQLQFKI